MEGGEGNKNDNKNSVRGSTEGAGGGVQIGGKNQIFETNCS